MVQPEFFDLDNRYESIIKLSDPLEVLDQSIRWKTFQPELSKALRKFKKIMRVVNLTIVLLCLRSFYCKASTN
jgi:hypothetical protein